jgi:mannose-6-phosphate isomerase-like protein (cupin superfamily)
MGRISNVKRIAILLAVSSCLFAADPIFLERKVSDVKPQPDDLTAANAKAASYKPLFGIGDQNADQLKGVARYGELTVGPGGTSALVSYPAEEQIYFVEEGSATLLYGEEKAPIKPNDFMYLPVGVRHGVANSSAAPVKVLVMGYKIPADMKVQPTPKLMLANTDDVQFQDLGQHGPTSHYKLMMGTTASTRDKLSAAYLMGSLFIMDFEPGGTNIPHNHPAEEEIYFLLRGSGDMVAGLDANGKEVRYPVTPGAAFFFKPGTQVGYYSTSNGQPHDLMLAARSRVPGMSMPGRGGGRSPANQPGRQQ